MDVLAYVSPWDALGIRTKLCAPRPALKRNDQVEELFRTRRREMETLTRYILGRRFLPRNGEQQADAKEQSDKIDAGAVGSGNPDRPRSLAA